MPFSSSIMYMITIALSLTRVRILMGMIHVSEEKMNRGTFKRIISWKSDLKHRLCSRV